jgi:molybdenum transport protein
MKIFNKTGVQTTLFTPSGELISKGVKFLEGEGLSGTLFAISRTLENLLRFSSGIATRTRYFVDKARQANPEIRVLTTRKTIPYTRKISIKAVKSGGASVHRLGLSEALLVYPDHVRFLGGIENLKKRLADRMIHLGAKMVTVEVNTWDEAVQLVNMGVDVIQLDGFSPADIAKLKKEIRKSGNRTLIAAAGEIVPENVQNFALSGADFLITSWPYHGEPASLSVTVQPIYDMF